MPDLYAQPLAPARERQVAGFFDEVALWFAEQVVVLPTPSAAPLALRLHGPLDAQKTDLAAVKSAIAMARRLAPATSPLPAVMPEPHFCYEATYVLNALTALLLRGAVGVRPRRAFALAAGAQYRASAAHGGCYQGIFYSFAYFNECYVLPAAARP